MYTPEIDTLDIHQLIAKKLEISLEISKYRLLILKAQQQLRSKDKDVLVSSLPGNNDHSRKAKMLSGKCQSIYLEAEKYLAELEQSRDDLIAKLAYYQDYINLHNKINDKPIN